MNAEDDKSLEEIGNYLTFRGRSQTLLHHPTDFSIVEDPSRVQQTLSNASNIRQLTVGLTRVVAESPEHRNELMATARAQPGCVAHHIYLNEDTKEEVVIADRIYLNLRDGHEESLQAIRDEFHLCHIDRIGKTHILQLTDDSPGNPVKVANLIAKRDDVACCNPKILPRVHRSNAPVVAGLDLASLAATRSLFDRQWHLTPQVTAAGASIDVQDAWAICAAEGKNFGDPDVVIAVIDDGFDLPRKPPDSGHDVFFDKKIIINDEGMNLAGGSPGAFSRDTDFHGTPVASIAAASITSDGMMGVAPNCALLPLRINLGEVLDLEVVLRALQFASDFADVVNCSFSLRPLSMDVVGDNCWFRDSVIAMTKTGGRRGKGLVIVFCAGNDDAPTFLSSGDNKNGIRFALLSGAPTLGEIKKGVEIHSGFPEIPGVLVVGAMTSLMRKAGYSNWGPHLTVAAPSDNGHEMQSLPDPQDRKDFQADYPGLGLVAAVNTVAPAGKPPHGLTAGLKFGPLTAAPDLSAFGNRAFYTDRFGGTSGAAPIVTGVVALMLSVNDKLTAADVIRILQVTADKEKDGLQTDLDLKDDPNLQGLSGAFVGDHSIFFGAGKVNAGRAVAMAAPPASGSPVTSSPGPGAVPPGNGD